MNKFTFTYFTEDNKIYGYRFGITRIEAQAIANQIFAEEGVKVYYMEGYQR